MKQKLIPPNENYEIVECAYCTKPFIRRKHNRSKQLAPGIRGWRMINCSKKCGLAYRKNRSKPKTTKFGNAKEVKNELE